LSSKTNQREQRLKQVTGFATRFARNQISEAEQVFRPIADGDEELSQLLWESYVAHVAGRLFGLVGTVNAVAILRAALATHENAHDH